MIFGVLACVTVAAPGTATGQETDYLMVKLGDEAATADLARDFLDTMSDWLGRHVEVFAGSRPRGWIANREADAVDLLGLRAPAIAFVPPGFYLSHLAGGSHPSEPIAQIPRFEASHNRYYLVTRSDGPSSIGGLKGRSVATTFDYDETYLARVVFPASFQPGRDFELRASENLSDELFDLIEGRPDGPDALLLDEELKRFFEEDELVWSEIRVAWSSERLPPDLVVAVGDWPPGELEQARRAFLSLGAEPSGKELLTLMSSSGFEPVDHELLSLARDRHRNGW